MVPLVVLVEGPWVIVVDKRLMRGGEWLTNTLDRGQKKRAGSFQPNRTLSLKPGSRAHSLDAGEIGDELVALDALGFGSNRSLYPAVPSIFSTCQRWAMLRPVAVPASFGLMRLHPRPASSRTARPWPARSWSGACSVRIPTLTRPDRIRREIRGTFSITDPSKRRARSRRRAESEPPQ